MYGNKAGMRIYKKTTLLWNNGGKGRQEDYLTAVPFAAELEQFSCFSFLPPFYSRVVFWHNFIPALLGGNG